MIPRRHFLTTTALAAVAAPIDASAATTAADFTFVHVTDMNPGDKRA
ncbi:MAG: hypothetical protein IT168_07295 [Bryobacterales bacterium]|nr:hypothetical protein [Bryobacterales bacterium]